jgi:hypothetical protein
MQAKSENQEDNATWQDRILCSDESCIGIIGPDGRCKECGKPYAGQLPESFRSRLSNSDTDDSAQHNDSLLEPPDDVEEEPDPGQTAEDDAIDWDDRVLCSDETCIGIIGPDGRCKTCGKPYQKEDE